MKIKTLEAKKTQNKQIESFVEEIEIDCKNENCANHLSKDLKTKKILWV